MGQSRRSLRLIDALLRLPGGLTHDRYRPSVHFQLLRELIARDIASETEEVLVSWKIRTAAQAAIILGALISLTGTADAFCPPGRFCVVQAPPPVRMPPPVRVGPPIGYRWNPYTPPSYYRQQNQQFRQAYGRYQQIQRNPYVASGNLAWHGVRCVGGALVIVGTDGLGAPAYAYTGYQCTQAGIAAWRYGQAVGRVMGR